MAETSLSMTYIAFGGWQRTVAIIMCVFVGKPSSGGGGSVGSGSSVGSAASGSGGPMGLGALFAGGAPKLRPVGANRARSSSPGEFMCFLQLCLNSQISFLWCVVS